MKYSFILPIYNVELYLEECVNSILMQTYCDYEIILVDDGSTDLSPMICDKLAEKDRRIKVIHKANGGQSDARNIGTKNATGDYIIFIDSDDFILSDKFLENINQKAKNNPDLIFYKHQKYYHSDGHYDDCKYSYHEAINRTNYQERIYTLVQTDSFFGMAWIKAIKRSTIINGNIQFDVNLKCEDMDWNYNLVLNSKSIELIDKSFIAYRQREGSVTATFKLKNLTDFIFTLEKWTQIVNNEVNNSILKNALLGSLAKYYSNMLVVYARLKDGEKRKYRKRIKELRWLLNHSMSNRPKTISKIYKIFGFEMTIFALQVIDCIRK